MTASTSPTRNAHTNPILFPAHVSTGLIATISSSLAIVAIPKTDSGRCLAQRRPLGRVHATRLGEGVRPDVPIGRAEAGSTRFCRPTTIVRQYGQSTHRPLDRANPKVLVRGVYSSAVVKLRRKNTWASVSVMFVTGGAAASVCGGVMMMNESCCSIDETISRCEHCPQSVGRSHL